MTSDELKDLRKRLKWSQKKAAQELGCAQRSIANWEGGKPIPHSISLAAAAVLYKLPPYGSR